METGLVVNLIFVGIVLGATGSAIYNKLPMVIEERNRKSRGDYYYHTARVYEPEDEEEEPNPIADKIEHWNSSPVVEDFTLGDCVRIVGESHEWYVIDCLDDDRYLLYYGYDLNDQKITLVASSTEMEFSK